MSIVAPAAVANRVVEVATPIKTASHASKLGLWCDRFIEAGWLAVVIIAPLFFQYLLKPCVRAR